MYKYKVNGKFGTYEYTNAYDCFEAGVRAAKRVSAKRFYIYRDGELVGDAEYIKDHGGKYDWQHTPLHEYKNPVSPKQALQVANSNRILDSKRAKKEEVALAKMYNAETHVLTTMIKHKLAEADKWECVNRLVQEGKLSQAQQIIESMGNTPHPLEIRDKIGAVKHLNNGKTGYYAKTELKKDIELVDMYRKHPSIKRRK